MESTQNLKKRIKSVANINKITKAMELVAATKMRRAQEIALASRPYAFVALDLLANLTLIGTKLPELLRRRKINKTLFVLVASDKGLAGAFNSSLFRRLENYILKNPKEKEDIFIAVGEKSFNYLSRKGYPVIEKFVNVGDFTTLEQVHPITDFILKGYLEKKWDKAVIFSTHFTSALKQDPMMREVLPVQFESVKETIKELIPKTGKFAELIKEHNLNFAELNPSASLGWVNEYVIEPSSKAVLEDLAKHLFFMQVYHLILEANASEHSSRRMAMKTASDNASDLGEELNLQYNKSRQAAITKEIIEISAGAEALS